MADDSVAQSNRHHILRADGGQNTRRAAECPICDDQCVIKARDDQPWNLWCPCCNGHDYESLWPDDYDVGAWKERAEEVEWHLEGVYE